MMAHNCQGITCDFPSCFNNPKNRPVRHRAGLRRMTLKEFRTKYGTNGVSDIMMYLVEHVPVSAHMLKEFKEIAADLRSLLSED